MNIQKGVHPQVLFTKEQTEQTKELFTYLTCGDNSNYLNIVNVALQQNEQCQAYTAYYGKEQTKHQYPNFFQDSTNRAISFYKKKSNIQKVTKAQQAKSLAEKGDDQSLLNSKYYKTSTNNKSSKKNKNNTNIFAINTDIDAQSLGIINQYYNNINQEIIL